MLEVEYMRMMEYIAILCNRHGNFNSKCRIKSLNATVHAIWNEWKEIYLDLFKEYGWNTILYLITAKVFLSSIHSALDL